MKRSPDIGNSPTHKVKILAAKSRNCSDECLLSRDVGSIIGDIDDLPFPMCESAGSTESLSSLQGLDMLHDLNTGSASSLSSTVSLSGIDDILSPEKHLEKLLTLFQIPTLASAILNHAALKQELKRSIYSEAHEGLKASLPSSVLTDSKAKMSREYLLSLTPRMLCEELKKNANDAF